MEELQSFIREYLNRTLFVGLHTGLLLLYLYHFGRAFAHLRRERKSLKELREEWEAERTEGAPEDDGRKRLADLRQTLEQSPRTSLTRQLRSIVGTTAAGEDFDTRRVLSQLGRSLTITDDIIRFCINGLVIVGLMGTLYAFYQMWSGKGADSLTADNSSVYLESLSTALIVSFVGLLLALITNFSFAWLRSRRQSLLEEVAAFLVPVADLLPTDAKTHLLLTNLLAPLERLVTQLTRQNDEVLRGLTEAVHTRTEQLNLIINQTAAEWQQSITAFRTETLTAVGNLSQATGRLTDSSHEVAGTMSEVSRALERTKDIGRIVDRLEVSSGEVIKIVSQNLQRATADWADTYVRAAASYEVALQQQSEMVREVGREVTTTVRADFETMVERTLAELNGLRGRLANTFSAADQQLAALLGRYGLKFIEELEKVSGAWRTEAGVTIQDTAGHLDQIVADWKQAVTATAGNVRVALDGSRDLAAEMQESVGALSRDLTLLQSFARAASETAGTPLYLGEVVERLGETNRALTDLASRLDHTSALSELQQNVVEGRAEMRQLHGGLAEIGNATRRENGIAAELLKGMNAQFTTLEQVLRELSAELRRLPERIPPEPRSQRPIVKAEPIEPPEPAGFFRRLASGFGLWGKRKGSDAEGR